MKLLGMAKLLPSNWSTSFSSSVVGVNVCLCVCVCE